VSAPIELLWAFIGLLLTIGGTFLEGFMVNGPWLWNQQGLEITSLGISYQIAAVLLISCVGGKNAGTLSQIAYLVVGLTLLPVFSQGGGLGYYKEPSFGYLLGFVPGAWFCGHLAFKSSGRVESLAASAFLGLGIIHLAGVVYLVGLAAARVGEVQFSNLDTWLKLYSIAPIPSQLILVCAVAVLSLFLRKLLFY
jgi:biotin transport system substrate-specific component